MLNTAWVAKNLRLDRLGTEDKPKYYCFAKKKNKKQKKTKKKQTKKKIDSNIQLHS